MEKLPEMTRLEFEERLSRVGMPVWVAYQEVAQANEELPDAEPEQVFARAYQILYDKFWKPAEGA